ncbi:unnamed protein product, partial [Nesidiocoris tenuis]
MKLLMATYPLRHRISFVFDEHAFEISLPNLAKVAVDCHLTLSAYCDLEIIGYKSCAALRNKVESRPGSLESVHRPRYTQTNPSGSFIRTPSGSDDISIPQTSERSSGSQPGSMIAKMPNAGQRDPVYAAINYRALETKLIGRMVWSQRCKSDPCKSRASFDSQLP